MKQKPPHVMTCGGWISKPIPRLEPPLQAGGDPHQKSARPTARGREDAARRAKSVMAIGRDPASAGAEIVVAVGSVDGRRHIAVPAQIRAEVTPERRCQHVRLVVVLSEKGGADARCVFKYFGGVFVLPG